MEQNNSMKEEKIIREFKITTLALKNKTTVFLLTLFLIVFGIISYVNMPKELYPDIVMPYVMVNTVYPGNPPIDIENLVTRPVEKGIDGIKGIKKITSTSAQDASMIFVEFNPDVLIDDALQDVKDAVDKIRSDLPNDLPADPMVMDIDFSEFPIININLSGDYSVDELKNFGEILEEEIEKISEISKVNIQGITEKEVKINVDLHKLESFKMSFQDIEGAVFQENMNISGGEIIEDGVLRTVRTIGEFETIEDIRNIIVKHEQGNIIYMKDVAEVINGFEDPNSFTRLDDKPVVSLQVVKKGGENLLAATAKIEKILEDVRANHTLPEDLKISVTNDQSEMVKKQLNSLENSMIISMLFVVMVLFFFLGTRNSLFVGLAIPLSMFMSFVILYTIGYRVNMIVLFSLILALGMLVDNAIVVVENIYRFIGEGFSKMEAAKRAVGEIAVPIIASTATTLAAFLPLAFWDSIMGEFMKYLPITLIIVLSSSLFVALIIIPVFSSVFVKLSHEEAKPKFLKGALITLGIGIIAVLISQNAIVGFNVFIIGFFIMTMNVLVMNRIARWFQAVFLIKLENLYDRVLRFSLRRYNPVILFIGVIFLLFGTIIFMGIRSPKVALFPSNDPTYINILAQLPRGTEINTTDKLMKELDVRVSELLEPYEPIVKSVLTNVGAGAKLENDLSAAGEAKTPYKGLITVSFVEFEERNGVSTAEVMKMLSDSLIGKYAGVEFTVEKNRNGPPTGKPINIEITGKDFLKLMSVADSVKRIIKEANIPGIEGIKQDLNTEKPEMIVKIDRDKARRFGLSTAQIASTIRTALFGKEISDFKEGEDEFPIQMRLMEKYRYNAVSLMNQKITFRNDRGKIMQVPISAVADFDYSNTFSSVKRSNLKRAITLYSNVIEGYNANDINTSIREKLAEFKVPGYEIKFTGEQQDMQESMNYIIRAFIIAFALIMIILVTQFNSFIKASIIMFSVVLSTIGVFGGLATFNMDFIIVMTGIGIVSLAGVVVNNAIVLIDYIELVKQRKREELGMEPGAFLPPSIAAECIVKAGKTRLRPVLLTAITTILGLLPMAVGINIDFVSYFTTFNPHISFGGDMNAMWSPMSWTVIFGLTFATFLTLIIVPVMYKIVVSIQKRLLAIQEKFSRRKAVAE